MFQRILVPLDGSERAERVLPIAGRIARATDGTVILMQVVNFPAEYVQYLAETKAFTTTLLDVEQTQAQNYLKNLTTSDDLDGVTKAVSVVRGAPAVAILAVVHEQQADLIVISSHGRTGFKGWALGNVAMKVARHSPVPVLVLREGGSVLVSTYSDEARSFRALVTLDGSDLAERALVPAAHLVAALSAPQTGALHLNRVVELPPADSQHSQLMDATAREYALSQAATYLSTAADQLRTGLGADLKLSITWSVVADEDVAHSIVRTAEEGEPGGYDLIAMATHGRSGIQRWEMGSVTERVLQATKRPLLIVRPHKTGRAESEEQTTAAEKGMGLA
jgi:nucleotide-binding universal stress UspA family protein